MTAQVVKAEPVDLVKPIDLGLDPLLDFVVVLRRYDVSDAPWGVHVVHVDVFSNPIITSRTVGRFASHQIIPLAARNEVDWFDLVVYGGDDGEDVLGCQLTALFMDYVRTQVVPMEWHEWSDVRLWERVVILNRAGSAYNWDDEPRSFLTDYIHDWDNKRAVTDVELPA